MNAIIKNTKRVVSMIIALSMLMSLVPMSVFAFVESTDAVGLSLSIRGTAQEKYAPGETFQLNVNYSNPDELNVGTFYGGIQFDKTKVSISALRPDSIPVVVGPDDDFTKQPNPFGLGGTNPKTGETHDDMILFLADTEEGSFQTGTVGRFTVTVLDNASGDAVFSFVNPQATTFYATSEASASATKYVVNSTGITVPLGVSTATLTLDPNNGTAETDAITENIGTQVTLSDPDAYNFTTPTGKQFAGWLIGSDVYQTGAQYELAADATATAQWNTVIDTITVEGIVPPVAGATADVSTVAISTTGLTIDNSLQWQYSDSAFEGNFVGGATYDLYVPFTVDDGYVLSANPTLVANGNPTSTRAEATYVLISYAVPAPTYTITVNNGSANPEGPVVSGTEVTITADAAPANKEFDKWTVNEGGITLADENANYI